MRRRIISLILSVLMLLSICQIIVLAEDGKDGSLAITSTATQVNVGDTFDITFEMNANTDPVGAINFTVVLPDGIEYVSHNILVQPTDFLMSSYTPETGAFGCAVTVSGKSGSFDVLQLTVKAKETNTGVNSVSVTLGNIFKVDGATKMDFGTVDDLTIITQPKPVHATGIELDLPTIIMFEGGTETITATLTPDNSTDTITWQSSNEEVATVEGTGNTVTIKAIAQGTATITATANDNVSATCSVTVEENACDHSGMTEHPAVKSTCTTQGNNLYYTCDTCGKVFKADKTETTVEAETLPLSGHSFTAKVETDDYLASAGDCQHKKTYYYKCANCAVKGSNTFASESYGDHVISDTWTSENDTHFHKCTVVGCDHKADTAACYGGTASCTKKAVCDVCKNPYGDLAEHDYTAEVKDTNTLKTPGTCKDEAVYYYSCKVCGDVEKNDEHTFKGDKDADNHEGGTKIINAKNPDHVNKTDGYTGDKICLGCEKIIEVGTTIPYGEHVPSSEWTTDGNYHWKVCSVEGCNATIEGSKVAHSSTGTNVATCQHKAICDVCKVEYGELAEHDFAETYSKNETEHWFACQTPGCSEKTEVTDHDFTYKKNYDTKSHWDECICGAKDSSSYAEHTLVKTQTEDTHTFACSGCNYSKTAKHSPEIINFVDATYDSEGYSGDVVCKDCEYLIAKGTVIPKRSFIIIFPPVTDTGNSGTGGNESGSETDPVKPEDWTNPFTDITETDECYEAVRFVNENGLIIGMSTTEFAPEVVMNRAMFVTILGRAEGIPEDGAADGRFEDVDTDTWYSPYIGWADESGIITGYSDTVFGPLDNITVEQACVILARYAEYLGYDISAEPLGEDSGFEDVADISDWAVKGMAWAVQSGIYTADSKLNPGAPATRAMVAMMLYRLSGVVTEFLG